MPRYDYECLSCGHVFELRQSFDDAPEATCPQCAGKSRRKFHAVPIIYKGSGFYTTDYKQTSHSPAAKDGKEAESSKETSKASKESSDSKEPSGGSSESKETAKTGGTES